MSSLDETPTLPMSAILEKIGFPAILTLRKANPDLLDLDDDTTPIFKLKSVDVTLESQKIRLNWILEDGNAEVVYAHHERGLIVSCEEKKKVVEDSNFLSAFCDDFESVMALQNSVVLDRFHVHLTPSSGERGVQKFLETFQKILEIHQIQTKYLDLGLYKGSEIMSILPWLDAETLKEIRFFNTNYSDAKLELEEVVGLEQWKKAEKFSVQDFHVAAEMHHFRQFVDIDAEFDPIDAYGVHTLKEAAIYLPKFQKYNIEYHTFENIDELVEVMGRPSSTGPSKSYWLYETINVNDFILEIEHHPAAERFEFRLVRRDLVPLGARIRTPSRYANVCTLL